MQGGNKTGLQPERGRYYGWLALAVVCTGSSTVSAADWHFHPRLDVAEVYTDNVNLAPAAGKQDEFITEVNPGFSINGQSTRIKLDMSYQLQNLFYVNQDSLNTSNHQLSATGSAELARELFFVDARSSITQQIVDPNRSLPLDNISGGNTTDVITYGISPYLKLRLGRYADGELRYAVDRVKNETASASDGDSIGYSARLNSGAVFTRFNWGFNFTQQDLDLNSSADSQRESMAGVARYRVLPTFNLLAHAGYENNDVPTLGSVENGSYWSVGGEWLPIRQVTVSATSGKNNWDADISISPTARTLFHLGYNDRTVGLNTGGVWSAELSHFSRRSTWHLSYSEEFTNTQLLEIANQQFFVLADAKGNLVTNPDTGLPVTLVNNVFALNNEQFIRKRFQSSVDWKGGKNDFIMSAYNEQRDYQTSTLSEDVVGANGIWTWRFVPRVRSLLAAGWEHRNPASTNASDDLWHTSVGLIRTLSTRTSATLELRHTARDSPLAAGDYDENRVTAQINMIF